MAELVARHLNSYNLLHTTNIQTVTICGELPLEHDSISTDVSARCRFTLNEKWRGVMPMVECNSPWVKRLVDEPSLYPGFEFGNPDWHINRNGSLCWEYLPHWRDEVLKTELKEGRTAVLLFAVTWMIHSVKWLLYRHHYATLNGIEKWPKDWEFWDHKGNAAEQEYERYRLTGSKR